MSGERMTEERFARAVENAGNGGVHGVVHEAERARAAEKAMWDALMKAQWAFRHACNGCDCQRVAAEAVDAVLEAHEVLP